MSLPALEGWVCQKQAVFDRQAKAQHTQNNVQVAGQSQSGGSLSNPCPKRRLDSLSEYTNLLNFPN